jgi:hypothetical protein
LNWREARQNSKEGNRARIALAMRQVIANKLIAAFTAVIRNE